MPTAGLRISLNRTVPNRANRAAEFPDFYFYFLFSKFSDFSIYGRYGPLDSFEIVSRGVGTYSTPGEAIPRIFEKLIFWASLEGSRRGLGGVPGGIPANSSAIGNFTGYCLINRLPRSYLD